MEILPEIDIFPSEDDQGVEHLFRRALQGQRIPGTNQTIDRLRFRPRSQHNTLLVCDVALSGAGWQSVELRVGCEVGLKEQLREFLLGEFARWARAPRTVLALPPAVES